jgi:integrase
MATKKIPGLKKIGDIWHIDKRVDGRRICESTGSGSFKEAEKYLIKRLEDMRQAMIYGVRPRRIFREAALKFVQENQHKRSILLDIRTLKMLDPYIGELSLASIHMGTLQEYIEIRKKEGVRMRTINFGLQIVRRILNLAASEWMDEYGLTWLPAAPKIKLLPEHDKQKPYPLSWEEQGSLFAALPDHLREMALFTVNTGCRDREVCQLRWEWEVKVPEIDSAVFIVPGQFVKNGQDRVVILNRIAKEVIERQRGKHAEFVFTYRQKPITRILNNGWKEARIKTGLLQVRVHDLKHTFGRRLRAAGVSFEDRQDLLGHKSSRITTHYSAGELTSLLNAANKVCEADNCQTLTLLKLVNNYKKEGGHEKFTNQIYGVA